MVPHGRKHEQIDDLVYLIEIRAVDIAPLGLSIKDC
jgi:hypothetical protein